MPKKYCLPCRLVVGWFHIWKHWQKHDNFYSDFGPKKIKSFNILVIKTFRFFLRFLIFIFFCQWDLQYIVFSSFLFQVKSVTGHTHSKYLHFLCFQMKFFLSYNLIYFKVFFTILVTMAAQHLKFSTHVSHLIISTQQSFWSKKLRFGRFKVWFGTKTAKIGHLNFMFWYLNMFKWACISCTDKGKIFNYLCLKKSIWSSTMGENWVLRPLPLQRALF